MISIRRLWSTSLFIAPLFALAQSPEDTVAAYFAAAKAGDKPGFATLLTGEFAIQKDQLYTGLHDLAEKGELSYVVKESVATGPAAHEIKIQISFVAADGKQKFSQPANLQLEQIDGKWRIAKQGTARNSADAAPADTQGRKPHDYAERYFAAAAAQDYAAIKSMCDAECFREALRFPIGAGTTDEQTERWFRKRMWRVEEKKFVHEECGLKTENGIYTVVLQITVTDEFRDANKSPSGISMPKKMRASLRFRLVDGLWKLVSAG